MDRAIRIFYELTSIPTYPNTIRVLPGEESFVAKENGTDEKRIDWERNMFSEKPGSQQQEGSVDLSIVVPAYNETERLPAMLDQAIEFLQNPKVWIFFIPRRIKKEGRDFPNKIFPQSYWDHTF